MKQFYAFLAATVMLTGSISSVEARQTDTRKHKIETTVHKKHHAKNKLRKAPNKMPSTSDLPEDIITELPDGVTGKLYTKEGIAAYYDEFWDEVGLTSTAGFLSEIAFDGDDIYMSNPFSFGDYDKSYIVGKVADGVATFTMPQYVANYYYSDDPDDYDSEYAMVGSITQDYDLILEDNQTISFKIGADGSLTNTKPGVGLFDTYIYNGSWEATGNGDILAGLKPFEGTAVETPQGLEFSQWNFFGKGDPYAKQYPLQIAFDGTDVYIKGIYEGLPDGTIKGTIEGSTISFEANQFIGINEAGGFCVYFAGTEYDDDNEEVLADPMIADYDAENKVIDFGEGIVNFTTTPYNDGEDVTFIDYFEEVLIREQTAEPPTSIEDPVIAFVEYVNDEYPGSVGFSIPIVYDEVNLINTKHLYYRVYFDGELQTVEPDVYDIEEPMTEIPYDYANGSDIDISASSGLRWFTVLSNDVTNVGIQAVYDDGTTRLESGITTKSIVKDNDSGIADIEAPTDAKPVYYDLTGRKVTNPAKGGFYIRHNGTKADKIVIR